MLLLIKGPKDLDALSIVSLTARFSEGFNAHIHGQLTRKVDFQDKYAKRKGHACSFIGIPSIHR